jgi:hypothetical protein
MVERSWVRSVRLDHAGLEPQIEPRRGSAPKAAVLKALKKGGTYVNVHTAKNPAGEIRGQIAVM